MDHMKGDHNPKHQLTLVPLLQPASELSSFLQSSFCLAAILDTFDTANARLLLCSTGGL